MYFPQDEMDTSGNVSKKGIRFNIFYIFILIGRKMLYYSSFRKRNSWKNIINI